MTLRPADFAEYFIAVHGHDPFPWQLRLVERLASENRWPDVLDLPTGTGKTAALDAAVFHLALQTPTQDRSAALRIVLVVDRRLVVDDAHRRAEKIADTLRDPSRCPRDGRVVVAEVAMRLRQFAGADELPLVAERLRGGAPLEHDWARTPTQPTILCSTVSQVGSRILFRGYGVSNRMRPVHAGLLGEDCLILLDEVHQSEPFLQTLRAVRTISGANVTPVVLTATPGDDHEGTFQLGQPDREHPILKERIGAAKPARLMKPIRSADPAGSFAYAARLLVEQLQRGGVAAPAVGVVVNRIDLARAIFERLRGIEDIPFDCLLLIGRSRDVDWREIESRLAPFRTGNEGRAAAAPLMVVATQCLEVGVDLDLDGLVTEAAPFDALRQRFGRLNRAGRSIPAAGAILVTTESLTMKADDPVYGDRVRKTWETLTAISTMTRVHGKVAAQMSVDFGVDALDQRLRRAKIDVSELVTSRARAPTLMPAYVDLWSQTSPPPATDPEVGLFLHGTERTAPEVSIVWRSDITAADLANEHRAVALDEILEMVPPRGAEMIEVPIWAAEAWLRRWNTARAARLADVEGREDDLDVELSETDRKAFRWAGADDPRTGPVSAEDLRPGDVLVVPAEYGGCDAYGWAPVSREPVTDVADEAAWSYRGCRYAVRVTSDVARWDRFSAVLAGTDDPSLDDLLAALPDEDAGIDEDLDPTPGAGRTSRSVREALEALREARSKAVVRFPYGLPSYNAIMVANYGLKGVPRGYQPVTEDEEASHTASRPISLEDHTAAVVARVERFTDTLGLTDLADDLRLAAALHDAGKADERFQILLAGDWWNRPEGADLAKSGRPSSRGARERAGLPKGWRHETRSVRLASTDPRLSAAHDPYLVLWLIGTHHGHGRPFFHFVDPLDDQGPQSLGYTFQGRDWATLFDKLRRHYGAWRLAWLEGILRLADHRASEDTGQA